MLHSPQVLNLPNRKVSTGEVKTAAQLIVTEDKSKIDQALKAVLNEEGASEDSSIQTIHTISQDSDPLDLPTPEKGD